MQRGAVHRQVADLARRPGRAPVQPPAQDGGEAEADAQPDQDETVGAAVAPSPRSAIAARFTSSSITTGLRETLSSASSAPSCHVGRLTASSGTGPRIDHAGAADHQRAQPGDLEPGARAGPLDGAADQLDRVIGPGRAAADLGHVAPGHAATAALTRSDSTYSPAT